MEEILTDWSIVSFLTMPDISKKFKIQAVPFKQPDGFTAWRCTGDIEGATQYLYGNPKIPILDYMREMRVCRHTLFVFKGKGA